MRSPTNSSFLAVHQSHATLLDQGSGVGELFRVLGSREPILAGQGSVSEGPPQAKVVRRLVLMVDLARATAVAGDSPRSG